MTTARHPAGLGSDLEVVRARLAEAELTDADRARIARRLAAPERRGRRGRTSGRGGAPAGGGPDPARLADELARAEARYAARLAAVPTPTYPEQLPVSERRDDILAAIRDHQVVVVAGETGSGKTTQLPKLCLELGRGVRGMIGHTQPRRIAARSVAERIADELGVDLGGPVGYAVRFDDRVGDTTLVKVMTDGVLLAEVQRDRDLLAYDTVIVDEAHERSLNIDFLLGYLTRLLPRRPDLKLVVTSATIDTARFAAHFAAPVVEVSGRTFPVEVRYRPLVDDAGPTAAEDDEGAERPPPAGAPLGDERDLMTAICDAVGELVADGPGDVLVFLPGERDIRDAADAVREAFPDGLEVLPLYARLTSAEQHKVFRPHRQRRVVLATNVAETSLTVPGVRGVVDVGTARISRYSHRTKVQRLPIEAVSRASADQRAGRCGRVAPGTCIRLYSEADYLGRPEFTDPEILRTNLASVILQMAAIGLGPLDEFPFVEPPDRRAVADGMALLEELGALEPGASRAPGGRAGSVVPRLTGVGRRLARLPVDPRLARMLVEAERLGCVREVTVIVAAMSVQDPRERPPDRVAEAAEAHRRFEVDGSDFLGFVSLYDHLQALQAELSGNQFRRRCRAEFLHVLRIREWQDLVSQLRGVHRAEGITPNREPADPDVVHRALLAGLLSHVGVRNRERGDYSGARGTRFSIGRGSVLARRQPGWVIAGELVETTRTWARTVGRIEPVWLEEAAVHVLSRSWSDPWWDAAAGQAVVDERATLYGLPVVTDRRVPWARVDPAGARAMFVQHALVEGDWNGADRVLARTRERLASIAALEERIRRRDLLAADAARFAFYDAVVPDDVVGARSFERWWRGARSRHPGLLDVPLATLLDPAAPRVDVRAYPDEWVGGGLRLPLRYRFAPGEPDDGVTARVALAALGRLDADRLDWHIPGFRAELVAALVRGLPKAQRRQLGAAADIAADVAAARGPADGPLLDVVAADLARRIGEPVSPLTWSLDDLPAHLRIRVEVVDADGRVRAAGRDARALADDLRVEAAAALAAAAPGLDVHGATSWTFGTVARRVEVGGGAVGYPTLVDEGAGVGLTVTDSVAAQADGMWRGTRRLLLLGAPLPMQHLQRRLTNATKLALGHWPQGLPELAVDCATAVADDVITAAGGPPYDAAAFARLARVTAAVLADRVTDLVTLAGGVIAVAGRLEGRLDELDGRPDMRTAVTDARRQLVGLVHPGFVASTGTARLPHLLRYLDALDRRLGRLPAEGRRDAERMAAMAGVQARYDVLADALVQGRAPREARAGLSHVRWMLEELRVQLWAESLGTAEPVSVARVRRALDAIGG
ncbi:MAG TPA: ATP-dependent RNA helicase HrpA [Acidimicrobiales bacterium]|nr:ATP-dependent RNA helicase HrpA [Acidimicrobiales bacterium]